MKDLKTKLYERSCFGIKALTAIYQAMDHKGDHKLDVDDFRWGLMDFGIQLSKEDAIELQAHFSSESCVNWSDFLNQLKVSYFVI